MTTISQVEVFPVGVPITRGFTFASGNAGAPGQKAVLVFVKITASSGEIGWGECRPMPTWSYETAHSVVTTLRHHLIPAILGLEIWDRAGLHQRMSSAIGRGPSTGQPIAKAALDLALHDLCARTAGLPLRAFLGGNSAPVSLPLSWTCTAHTADEAARDVEAGEAAGYAHFNFKAAVAPATDLAVARELVARAPAGAFIWADCNQGFQLHDAVRMAQSFEQLGVSLLEQPLAADQLHLMAQLRARTTIALAVDEASVSPGDFFAHARAGLVDYLVVKVTRSGGLWPSLQQLAVAASAGLPFVVSGLTDGLLTKMAASQLSAAAAGKRPLALNGSQFLDESALYPQKAFIEHHGSVHLDATPGIGVHPDEAQVRALALPAFATF
jgi:L-alanine-DL-glutamate epimerase-like enolase superfamily enzyme